MSILTGPNGYQFYKYCNISFKFPSHLLKIFFKISDLEMSLYKENVKGSLKTGVNEIYQLFKILEKYAGTK